MLYVVSTPIGNLGDMTYRAVDVLTSVDLIAAEDTRHTRILLNHYNIKTPVISYHEHSKLRKAREIIDALEAGKDVALVTDAGTPCISDPGYNLIRLALAHDIKVTAIPGATAFVAALTLSGLPQHNFIFEGFLPVKTAARKKKLAQFKEEERTFIFYESPHRLVKALKDIQEVLDDPVVVCARELTKKFEEVLKNKASVLVEHFENSGAKGEFVILINLAEKPESLYP
ncbi:MAG: 16S rRNA (cytidine(1402)-2'-O)-methyltransferase [Candidatus Omnitrophica bacterium]|nr:16S rRNA (cytidine(1402)-2'-O)-methyltransferase [Candidatus Omnitrophota bacterium]